ncbi:hexokinase domain-containing protein [Hirsutella rhossiliensis]|uniref:Phosphotransferase n=1 Tax=Hirsutella rhossiliensis TaxID=111463 RepID=A0A9P8MPP9_9HYPO|nr:hexokinase domain-containing protein [Hirsutella rhossiliensis]KAH0958807.1 hexokinase domain-containing protein [Hirsutella rhossiliensis]
MTTFPKAFIAVIVKSLLRGKSLIQAILAYCIAPIKSDPSSALVRAPSAKSLQEFLKDAEAALLGPVSGHGLLDLSAGLKKQFFERLQTDMQCMLPSYSHRLPTGNESGQYVAVDVGGSTLRVALVELRGREAHQGKQSDIVSMRNFRIAKAIKDLEGMAFFDWMAEKIRETLSTGLSREHGPDKPIPLALAWSFPLEGLVGEDLGRIVKSACEHCGLNVELRAILNDSSACLLSRAYSYTSTRFGLILGTGVNMAAFLPVRGIGRPKFGVRPDGWFDQASHVIVNTELGMFGHGILPMTRWDRQLTKGHPRPDFQPLEHLVSGMYIGEIVRLALVEAIAATGMLGGVVPPSLENPYSLGADTLSLIERWDSDGTSELTEAIKIFSQRHPSSHTPTTSDLVAVKALASFVSVRSSAIVATCVFTMWYCRLEAEEATTVAFNGSVIESYSGYLGSCQRYVDDLVESKGLAEPRSIHLVPAKESSLMGAAVALACVERDD